MKRVSPILLNFKPSKTNTGALTINERRIMTLHKDGEPLTAGALVPGDIIEFYSATGEVVTIQRIKGPPA